MQQEDWTLTPSRRLIHKIKRGKKALKMLTSSFQSLAKLLSRKQNSKYSLCVSPKKIYPKEYHKESTSQNSQDCFEVFERYWDKKLEEESHTFCNQWWYTCLFKWGLTKIYTVGLQLRCTNPLWSLLHIWEVLPLFSRFQKYSCLVLLSI